LAGVHFTKEKTITKSMVIFVAIMRNQRNQLIQPSTNRISVRANDVLLHAADNTAKRPNIVPVSAIFGTTAGSTSDMSLPKPRVTLKMTRPVPIARQI
jgi:hypothetical protein